MSLSEVIEDPRKGVDIEALRAFEVRQGVTLPFGYRQFLLAANGGLPRVAHRYLFVGEEEPMCDIQMFLGIHPNGPDHADIEKNAEWVSLPRKMVPIANDSGGNLLLLDLRDGPSNGEIGYWDGAAGEKDGVSHPAVYRVSSSFEEFIQQTGEWAPPTHPAWLRALELDKASVVLEMIDGGLSPHVDYEGLSLVELAAMHAQNAVISRLIDDGAELGDALAIAKTNAEFSPKHRATAALLEEAIRNR